MPTKRKASSETFAQLKVKNARLDEEEPEDDEYISDPEDEGFDTEDEACCESDDEDVLDDDEIDSRELSKLHLKHRASTSASSKGHEGLTFDQCEEMRKKLMESLTCEALGL